MKIFIKARKFISVITALCLLISFVIGPTAVNAMTNEEATAKYKQIFKDFMLPYNYGQITSAHYAGTDRVIINIQDLHCHPKVQKNISNIIEIFDKSFGVKNVYLEGVYGRLSTKWITDRIENIKKGEILDKMLETGRLTGAEYYSATSGKTEIIRGLEEKEPYLDNLKRFGEIVENQERINLILTAMDESLSKIKQQYYTKRQYKLEELSKNYRDGTITPQKYYALLSKHIEKLGIDLNKYENTFTYITLLEMQKTLDYSKITNELQNLILLLRENLANSAYQMLVDNTENFSKIDKLYGYIVRISRELGLDLTVNFPNLDNYFGYIEFSQKINPLELIVEEKKLTEEINTRFSETKAQREVVFLTNFEKYLKDYVSSKITSDDYEYYKENIDTFRQLWNKYVDNRVLSLLDEYLAEADKFYKINTDRNIYFTNNMFTERDVLGKLETEVEAKGDVNKIIDNMKGVKEIDVVITGGFHSQTVTEILKNHGVSYIVITPNVTDGVKLAEETYYEIAKEQSKISFQTLATLPFSAYPENLRVRAAVMAFGKDIAKEIFPNKVAEIDSMDMRKFTDEEKAIAQQLKKLRKSIEESKFLESDDKSLEDFIEKISGETVDKALLEYVNLEDLKRILTGEEAGSIKKILEEAAKRRDLSENGTTMQQAIESFKDIFRNIEDRFTSQEEYSERQKLINLIRTLPKLSNPHKKLLMSRDGKHKRILEELSKYDYDRLEKYGQEDLQHYLKLTKQLWNIKEITSPDQVRREIEESFAKVEMFFTLIGYSAPQGNYEEITMSVLAPLMEKISKELGKERFGILSSPTASQGSIDAASTVLSQMYDALMVYITAKSYLGYVEPEKFPGAENFKKIEDFLVNMDKADLMKNGTNLREFLNAFKFVAENGDVYSKAVAQTKNVPNFAIIIGGRAVSIENDLINAYEEGNDIFLINSRLLAAQSPAITEKRAINNSVEYFLFLVDLIDKGVIRVVKRNNKGEIEDEDKALMAKGIIEFITDDIVFDSDKVTGLSPEEQELYKLLRSNELSPKIKKLIGILFEKGVKNRDDLGKLKIHVMDLDDADIDTTAGEKKVKEQLKEKGKTLAEKIFEIIKNFIKPALTADDLEWAGSVKSAEVEVQAFDLEYAKSHGYLEGVEEAEAKYDEDGYRYYVLKSEYDKGRHVTARIYDADPDNSTLSAKTNASVNPMFVVSEKGSVSFMGREKFERIYRSHVSKDKTVGQIFNATKREVEVEVSFAEPMSIIETDEGRDTVLPYYIVVKGIGKPYAMSIEEFMRIYPQGKNPEFYKQHKEQIDKLLSEYSNFEGQTEQKESIEQQEEQTQQQVSKQQTQKKKKVNIRNIIVSLLLSAVLAFSALNIGSSLAERTDVATAPSGIEMTLETGVDVTQETQEFQEAQEIVAPEISQEYIDDTWHYFDNNDIGYRSSSREDFRDSIIFSNQPNVLRLVQELKNLLRERLDFPIDDDTKIIFMKGTGKNNAACACFEINTIVICVDNLSTDSMDSLISLLSGNIPEEFYSRKYDENEISPMDQALSLLQQFVHEGTHLDNFKNKNLSPLEDEMTAIYAEITVVHKLMDEEMLDMDLLEKCSVRISKPDMRLDTGERVNHVAAMKYLAFENAVTKGESQILRDFRKAGDTNVSFYNVHYADNGIIYPKNNLKDVGPIEEGLVSTGMILILVDNETGASISYVTDVGINVDFKPTKEQLDDLRINHQQQKTEEQGETTKDGTRSRVKTVESSVGKGKQAKQSTGQMTREEIRGILERTPLNSNRVKKAKIINSFVYIAYNLNVSKEVLNKFLLPLARELSERRIDDISTEANYLTFKILLNKYFQENKQTKTRMTDYEDAMKMGRLLYYTIGDKAADLTEQQIDQILPLLMDIYYKGVEQLQSRNTVTNKTGFYCLLGMERECTNEGWESIFNLLGINPTREYFKCTGKSWKDRDIAGAWLDAIRNYPKNKAEHGLENIYVIYSGHGQPTHLSTGDYSVKVEDIVEALLDAEKNGAKLNEITIDLATCWSYFSSINIIELLKERGAKTFPNIVTDAGYESLKGKFIDMKSSPVSISSTDLVSGSSNVTLSNKEVSLIEYILTHKSEFEERKEKGLTLADFHNAERASANYTVFAVTNEEMENLFDNLRQKVFEMLDLSSDEITYGTKEMEITEYLDRYEEHERTVLVQRWLAKKGNMIYMELLLAKTKAILDWIGNTKIIRALYKDNAGENFKNTRLGKAIGVNLETFAFWMPKFVAAHNFRYASQDSGARAVVWRIRSLSIGIGVGFGVLFAIINLINPITATIVIPAIITTLTSTLLTANIFHYFYDIGVYNGIDPSELDGIIAGIDREQAIKDAKLEDIQQGFTQLIEQKSRIITISDFLREKGFLGSAKELFDSDGIALGLLSHELLKDENNEGIFVKLISAICRTTNIADWQIALRYFADRKPEWGLVGVTSDKYMPELIEYCKRTNKKIYFFLPNETKEYSRTRGGVKVDPRIANNESSRTRNELKWLNKHPEALPYVEFVVGAYDFLDVESVEEYNKYFSDDRKTTDTVSAMLRTPELFDKKTESKSQDTATKGQNIESITFNDLLEKNNGGCDIYVEQSDGSIATITFNTMSGENVYVSIYSQLLPDGTIVDMKGKKLTLEEINKQFNINIKIDKDKQVVTVENAGAKSISPFVNFLPFITSSDSRAIDEVIKQIKKQNIVDEDKNIDGIIADINSSGQECSGYEVLRLEEIRENPKEFIDKLKKAISGHKLLAIYPYYLDGNVADLSNVELYAMYCYISLLFGDLQIALSEENKMLAEDLRECMKNAFLHGNALDPRKPIYVYCDSSMNNFSVYNTKNILDGNNIKDQRKKYFGTRTNILGGNHIFYQDLKWRNVNFDIQENKIINGNEYYRISIEEKKIAAEKEVKKEKEQIETNLINQVWIKSKRGKKIVEILNAFIKSNQSNITGNITVAEYMINEFIKDTNDDEYIIEVIENYLLGKVDSGDAKILIKTNIDELQKEVQQLQNDSIKKYIIEQLDNFQIIYAKNLLIIAKANVDINIEALTDYTKKFISDFEFSDLFEKDSSLAIRIFNVVRKINDFLNKENITVDDETFDVLKKILLYYFKGESVSANDDEMVKAVEDFFNVKYKGLYSPSDETQNRTEEQKLFESVKRSGIDTLYDGNFSYYAKKYGAKVSTIEGFSREINEQKSKNIFRKLKDIILNLISKRYRAFKNLNGFSLGLSGRNIVAAISEEANLMPWEDYYAFYDDFYKKSASINNIDDHMKHLIADSKLTGGKIVIFVQTEIFGIRREEAAEKSAKFFEENQNLQKYQRVGTSPYGFGVTTEEIMWLKQHPESLKYVEFVFDAYDYFSEATQESTSIYSLAKFYRENLVEKQQSSKTSAAEQESATAESIPKEREELIKSIEDEYKKFENYAKDAFMRKYFENMEKEDIKVLVRYLKILRNLDKKYEHISSLYGSYTDFIKYTDDDGLIMDFILGEADLYEFFDKVKKIKLNLERDAIKNVIVELPNGRKYSIEITLDHYHGIYSYGTSFAVTEIDNDITLQMGLNELEQLLSITLRTYREEIFFLPYGNKETKVYLDEQQQYTTPHVEQTQQQTEEIEFESIVELVKAGINPTKEIIDLISQFFGNQIEIQGNMVLVKDRRTIKGLDDKAIENLTIIDYVIDKNAATLIGGAIIGVINGKTIRAYKSDNSITFYSKQGLDGISELEIEDLFIKAFSSGMKNLKIKEGAVIAFATEKDRTVADIQNRLKNTQTDTIMNPVNLRYDFTDKEDRKISREICKGIKDSTGINTFMITRQQAETYAYEISSLIGEYNFVIVSSSEQDFITELQENTGDKDSDYILDMSSNDMSVTEVRALLERIRNAKLQTDNSVTANVFVKFSAKTSEKFDNFDIYGEYGIIPIVVVNDVPKVKGKKEVYGILDEDQIDNLKGNEISGFIIDDEIFKSKSENNGIRSFLENLVTINEMTPERKYRKGINAALSSKFDYTVTNLQALLNTGILSKDLKTAKEGISALDIALFNSDVETQAYIKYQIEKGNYEEVLGFIRGVVMRTVATNIGDILDIDKDALEKDIKTNEVQAILIMTIQRLMKEEKIEDLYKMTIESDTLTVEQIISNIRKDLNVRLDDILRQSEYKIEVPEVLSTFDGIPELLMDSYGRKANVAEQAKISILTVRSILAAA